MKIKLKSIREKVRNIQKLASNSKFCYKMCRILAKTIDNLHFFDYNCIMNKLKTKMFA